MIESIRAVRRNARYRLQRSAVRGLAGVSVGGLRFLMTRLTGFAKPVEDSKASLRDMRAVAVGALGEALVRAELEVLGWPMLRNVIVGAPGRSVEIDQLARAPGGVIVLETKTYSGHVDGDLGSKCWILSLRDGRSFVLPNAVQQNAAHMRAVRRVIDGASVPVRRWPFRAAAREGRGAGCGTPRPTGRRRSASEARWCEARGSLVAAGGSRRRRRGVSRRARDPAPRRCGRPHAAAVLTSAGDKAGSPTP